MKTSIIDKLKELERIVGPKQIKIDYLEKIIEIADKEVATNIKKLNTKLSKSLIIII